MDKFENDDIGFPESNDQIDNNEQEGDIGEQVNQSKSNAGQGWDDTNTSDSFSVGSSISNQRNKIVVIGRIESGKTVFLTRLYVDCWNAKSGLRMACTSGQDHLRYMEQYDVMEKGKWPAATVGSTYFTIDLTRNDVTIPMVVLDYSGETFKKAFTEEVDDEQTRELKEHVDRACSVLITVDPGFAMHGGTLDKVDDDYGIANAINYVRQSPNGSEIPIAIVMTKCDVHAKKIMDIIDKDKIKDKGQERYRKFLKKYFNSWFYGLGLERTYRIFPIAAVRTRTDARGSQIPDLSKPAHKLMDPIIWCFDIVQKEREHEQIVHLKKEQDVKFSHFQKIEREQLASYRRKLLIFWIVAILFMIAAAWTTSFILNKNSQPKQNNETSMSAKQTSNTTSSLLRS
jgi:hypothetical protein